jgi:CRISPR/Cas system-associated endoribonuclease Cas2
MLLPTDQAGLNRDTETRAVINVDSNAYALYKQMRDSSMQTSVFEQRLNRVDSDIAEIKQMLQLLILNGKNNV